MRILLCGLRGGDVQVTAFQEDLEHLKARAALLGEDSIASSEFERKWKVSAVVARNTSMSLRPLGRDSVHARALFAHAMRNTFPVTACTDRFIGEIQQDLENRTFAVARRARSGVSLREVNQMLISRLAPDELVQFQTGHVSTQFGYFEDIRP